MSLNFDSPTFTGIVRAQALNVGSSSNYDVPMVNSGLIINPNFSNPSIANNTAQNIGSNASLLQWNFLQNSENDYLVLNRNSNIPQDYSQYLSVSSTNGILYQNLNIVKTTNYRISANVQSFSQNTLEVLLNNVVVATWEVTSSWNTFSANFLIQNLGNNVLGFRNITNNAVYNITGVSLLIEELQVGNVSLDVSGNVFVQSGFVINKQNNSSSMSIISNNLNLNSNTNVTSNLKLSYLGAGIVRSDNNGNLTSGIVSNAETSANVQPLANTIMLRDGNGFSQSTTPALTSNNTTVATTEFVQNKINELVDNAPEMMNTLNELATAITENNGTQLLQAINLKADKIYVDTNLDTKVNTTTYLTAVNNINNSISGNKQKADVSLNALNSYLNTFTEQIDVSLNAINGSLNTLRQGTDVSLNALNQSITDQITNGSSVDSNFPNKLVKRDNAGTIWGFQINLSDTGFVHSDTSYVLTRASSGYMYSTQIQNKHVQSNANIAGSKLAARSIPNDRLQSIDLNTNAGTIPERDANGCVLTATVAQSDNSDKAASTAFVRTAINNLINGANINLDTLNELANAIGNDASFVTTVTDRLGSLDASLNLKTDQSVVTSALALKADQSVVDASLNLKADQSAVTSALALKADQSVVDASLNLKAEQSVVTSALALKADQIVVDASLNLKADQSAVTSALALKADQSVVDSSLNLKVDQSVVTSALALKADQSVVDASLNLKADQSAVTSALALKADQSVVTSALALKADQSVVTSALALKADQSVVTSALALKANLSYVDASLNSLQNSVNQYLNGTPNIFEKVKNACSQICFVINGTTYIGSGWFYAQNTNDLTQGYFITAAHCAMRISAGVYYKASDMYIQNPITTQWIRINTNNVFIDGVGDIALIKTNIDFTNYPNYYLKISDVDPEPGDTCYIIGNPGGLDDDSISIGCVRDPTYVSPNGDQITECIYVNCPGIGGNSGGPIINAIGDVIGIFTFSLSTSVGFGGGSNRTTLTKSLSILKTSVDNKQKRYLGLSWIILSPFSIRLFYNDVSTFPTNGVYITNMSSNSPFVGILNPGDLLLDCSVNSTGEYFKFGNKENEKTPGILLYYYTDTPITISFRNTATKITQTANVTLNIRYADVSNLLDAPLQTGLNEIIDEMINH